MRFAALHAISASMGYLASLKEASGHEAFEQSEMPKAAIDQLSLGSQR